jgi:hypothetical protein
MTIRELRITPELLLALIGAAKSEPRLPHDSHVTDVALDHGHTPTHRDRPPVIVLQIQSGEFSPEDDGRPLLPGPFKR